MFQSQEGAPPLRLAEFAATVSDLALAEGQGADRLVSLLCRERELTSDRFRHWITKLRQVHTNHRKLWELAYICQALAERGMLAPGRRGLAFAVGQEQLPALFADMGCEITATDLAEEDQRAGHWADSGQWSKQKASLNALGLCPEAEFERLVDFQRADMGDIPPALTGYDFTWSTCSFEHLGSAEAGSDFLLNQLRCLKPGGWSVHTTEFNLSSNDETLAEPYLYVFRLRDIARIIRRLRAEGHYVEPLDLGMGDGEADRYVDLVDPVIGGFHQKTHLRLQLGHYACTSIGLIIRKADKPDVRGGN